MISMQSGWWVLSAILAFYVLVRTSDLERASVVTRCHKSLLRLCRKRSGCHTKVAMTIARGPTQKFLWRQSELLENETVKVEKATESNRKCRKCDLEALKIATE